MGAHASYRIRIGGHLDPAWSAWFDGLTVTRAADGTTELEGPLPDQSALLGLLSGLRSLGGTLLLVQRLHDGVPPEVPGALAPRSTAFATIQ